MTELFECILASTAVFFWSIPPSKPWETCSGVVTYSGVGWEAVLSRASGCPYHSTSVRDDLCPDLPQRTYCHVLLKSLHLVGKDLRQVLGCQIIISVVNFKSLFSYSFSGCIREVRPWIMCQVHWQNLKNSINLSNYARIPVFNSSRLSFLCCRVILGFVM